MDRVESTSTIGGTGTSEEGHAISEHYTEPSFTTATVRRKIDSRCDGIDLTGGEYISIIVPTGTVAVSLPTDPEQSAPGQKAGSPRLEDPNFGWPSGIARVKGNGEVTMVCDYSGTARGCVLSRDMDLQNERTQILINTVPRRPLLGIRALIIPVNKRGWQMATAT
ncbi:hypothetical protein B0H17DRAFT_1144024 [Mycena rosella]|uniref:Uncharacterized protein n=1 Tax=Mycena rosella TaxID=1033263 RepID=A0AAD7CUA9_MYCRO|nr:hypothetical protein B0H17DRAFT_1144024 [Mycena rosella]